MMASTLADSASRSPSRLSDNPSKKRLCLQANAATIASTYTYAGAAGLRIARVLAIHDGGQGGYMQPIADMEARMVAPPPVVAVQAEQGPPVMAGTNANVVTVRVDFALEAK